MAEAESEWLTMRMAVCATQDARAACGLALRTLTPPRLSPSKDLLEAPIWTTWARYFSRVCQEKVLKYAHEIVSRGLQVCVPAPLLCMAVDVACLFFEQWSRPVGSWGVCRDCEAQQFLYRTVP